MNEQQIRDFIQPNSHSLENQICFEESVIYLIEKDMNDYIIAEQNNVIQFMI